MHVIVGKEPLFVVYNKTTNFKIMPLLPCRRCTHYSGGFSHFSYCRWYQATESLVSCQCYYINHRDGLSLMSFGRVCYLLGIATPTLVYSVRLWNTRPTQVPRAPSIIFRVDYLFYILIRAIALIIFTLRNVCTLGLTMNDLENL